MAPWFRAQQVGDWVLVAFGMPELRELGVSRWAFPLDAPTRREMVGFG